MAGLGDRLRWDRIVRRRPALFPACRADIGRVTSQQVSFSGETSERPVQGADPDLQVGIVHRTQ